MHTLIELKKNSRYGNRTRNFMMRSVIPEVLFKLSVRPEYPEPSSISSSSSDKHVSNRAAMSMSNLPNSLDTKAVPHFRNFEEATSRRVLTFQQHIFIF